MEETKVVFGSAENGRCGLVFLENETGLVKKKKRVTNYNITAEQDEHTSVVRLNFILFF